MNVQLTVIAAIAVAATVAHAQPRVVITEIMYDPHSNERRGEAEWVEIANLGSEPIEINNWHLDDEDRGTWGTFSCTLAPGGVAVLINQLITEEQFRAAWDEMSEGAIAAPKLSYQVIRVKWGSLSNNPSATDEILTLRDDKDEVVCEVNIQADGNWPTCGKSGGPSVWLADLSATSFNDGRLWRKSEAGVDGARLCRKTDLFSDQDVGSLGFVPGLSADSTPPDAVTAPQQPQSKPEENAKKDTIDY